MSTISANGIWPWLVRRHATPRPSDRNPRRESRPAIRWYRVKVDFDRLRSHVSPERQAEMDDQRLRRWLRRSGFVERGDWWVAKESSLSQLAPSEITESQPIEW